MKFASQQECNGVDQIREIERLLQISVETGRDRSFLLAGCDDLRCAIEGGAGCGGWVETWAADEAAFRAAREPWLLYR